MSMDPVALQKFLELRETARARMDGVARPAQPQPKAKVAAEAAVQSFAAAPQASYADRVASLVRDSQATGRPVRNLGNFIDLRA